MSTQNYQDRIFSPQSPAEGVVAGQSVVTLGTQEPNSTIDRCIVDAAGTHWGLKMPGNVGSIITNTSFSGGISRALDMVQCRGQSFMGCHFLPGNGRAQTKSKWSLHEQCDIGIKGSSHDITFDSCVMTDLLLGDHDIYDNPHIRPKVRNITLKDCVHPNGKDTPIIVRCLNAERPILVNTNAVVLVYPRPVVLAYFWFAGRFIDSRIGTPTDASFV